MYSNILDQACAMAREAKDGTMKIKNVTYTFKFDVNQWVYDVYDQNGELVTRFNTKKLTNAKRFLRWHLDN
jgi:hypothetical protein